MAQTYSSRDGDVVDQIAWRQYGAVDADILRLVLAANPGIADYGPMLPAGVAVVLPDIPEPATVREGVALWD